MEYSIALIIAISGTGILAYGAVIVGVLLLTYGFVFADRAKDGPRMYIGGLILLIGFALLVAGIIVGINTKWGVTT